MLAVRSIRTARVVARITAPYAPAAADRSFWSSSSKPEPVNDTDELVAIPEVETLLRDGIRSIGYNDADTEVMKDAMMWAQVRSIRPSAGPKMAWKDSQCL